VTLLILGLILWYAAHLFKRMAPDMRAGMGDKAKGPIAIALLVSVGLMVWGYLVAEVVPIYLYGVGGTKGVLYPKMRHPMLWGTVIWAVSHLLVNGDQASIVLFGGIGVWALISMALINRAQGWAAPTNGRGIKGDAMNLAGTLILYGLIAGIHIWSGHSPFVGTYG
jgi:uncharacterized membrane protein